VDEDQQIRQSYEAALSSNGYDVITACTAYQALAVCKFSANVDLVIVDRQIHGVDGWKLAECIKILNPLLPVVMVSSVSPELWEIHSCVDAALAKGASIRSILDRIEILLTERVASRAEGMLLPWTMG
jgi:DNA-binding response OmpR family regulator